MSTSNRIKGGLAVGLMAVLGGAALSWWLYGSAHALAVAEQAMTRQEWPAAQRRLGRYLALHHHSGRARLMLAQTLAYQGHVAEAVAQLQRIPDHDPVGLDARIHEGELLLGLDQAARAERVFRIALKLDPGALRPYRGILLIDLWEDREADGEPLVWTLYDRVDPREQCFLLAQLFQLQYVRYPAGRIEPRLRRFIAHDPADLDARVALAQLQRRAKEPDAARALLEPLDLPPGHLEGRSVLLHCYLDLGDAPRARALLDAWPADQRQDVRYQRALGTYLQTYYHQWDQSVECFRRVLAAGPDDWEVRHRLGDCLQMLGRTEEARHQLRRAERGEARMKQLLGMLAVPGLDDPATRAGFGQMYEDVGRLREARCWYDQTLAIDPSSRIARAGLKRVAGEAAKVDMVSGRRLPGEQG